MERVQRTVEIKLTPEECEILWKAEQLLREMEKEISGITTPVYQSDKEEIAECLQVFGKITSRYDVHITLGVDGEKDDEGIPNAASSVSYGEEKAKLLDYIENPITTTAQNRMGSSENFYNPYYCVKETFTKEEICKMTEDEISYLLKLAANIGSALY